MAGWWRDCWVGWCSWWWGEVGAWRRRCHVASSVWAVPVMGPGALLSHCGSVGQLLREVLAVWEQGRAGVGEEEQLLQLWQVQLELEGLVGGVAERGGGSSGSSSGPGQLRDVLPHELLRAADAAAGEGPGGVQMWPGQGLAWGGGASSGAAGVVALQRARA